MTLTLTMIVAFACADVAHAAHERITLSSPSWVPPLIRRLAVCESRGVINHRAGHYEGIVSWYSGTWDLDKYPGMPDHAYQASLRQQVRVAVRSVARGRYFGCLNYGWVRG